MVLTTIQQEHVNRLWLIEHVWKTLFTPFTMKISKVIWIFATFLQHFAEYTSKDLL